MSLFQYTAIRKERRSASGDRAAPASPSSDLPLRGEIAGESGADVRAQLRRAGLIVIDLEPLRGTRRETDRETWRDSKRDKRDSDDSDSRSERATDAPSPSSSPRLAARAAIDRYLRARRRAIRAEMFDALATLQDGGMPLLQSLDAMLRARAGKSAKRLLLSVRESVKDGRSLADAFLEHSAWFDPVEVSMVEAGQRGGTLPSVLRNLADRHERSGALLQKLSGALAYPAVVLTVGLLVVSFLATKTLPELVTILENAKIEPPALTLHVIGVGKLLSHAWWVSFFALAVVAVAFFFVSRRGGKGGSASQLFEPDRPDRFDRFRPELLRKLLVGRAASTLSELVSTGVPLVEALRVLAPTSGSVSLSRSLLRSADALERGETLSSSFQDDTWFDEEFLRLLEIGQTTGELPTLLSRIGARYERSASRAIDRLAALLEPASILLLAALVGTVALAAVLPLFKLQEVL